LGGDNKVNSVHLRLQKWKLWPNIDTGLLATLTQFSVGYLGHTFPQCVSLSVSAVR